MASCAVPILVLRYRAWRLPVTCATSWADSRWGKVRLEHWSNAIDQGMHAAQTALSPSGSASFSSIPYFWSEWYGTKIQLVGRADGEETLTVGAMDEGRFIVLYRSGGELRGGLTVGRPGETAVLRRLVSARATWSDALTFAASLGAVRSDDSASETVTRPYRCR
jgi:Reductase C-terminal